jgi:hypothetical protein
MLAKEWLDADNNHCSWAHRIAGSEASTWQSACVKQKPFLLPDFVPTVASIFNETGFGDKPMPLANARKQVMFFLNPRACHVLNLSKCQMYMGLDMVSRRWRIEHTLPRGNDSKKTSCMAGRYSFSRCGRHYEVRAVLPEIASTLSLGYRPVWTVVFNNCPSGPMGSQSQQLMLLKVSTKLQHETATWLNQPGQ